MVADTAAPYLLALRLEGRRVVVVGGGSVAARRVPGLLDAGADVLLISPGVTPSLHDLVLAGRIGWQRRGYAPGDCAEAWLVCACTDDPQVNAAVAADAGAARIWSVRADDSSASAAWTPASGHAGDLRFGVVSGDPQRSAGIRDAVLAGLQDGTLRTRRRRHIGRVALVGGGPGDPGLITVRGRQLLAEADVVVADRLAPRALLDELAPDVELVDAGKIPRGRAMTQDDINAVLVERARRGRSVVRLKGGDPFVFGRGGEEVLACLGAGVPVTVVPGVTSAVGVPTAAGIPVTHRGITQELCVVSAHLPPGDPRVTVDWAELARSGATLVLMMGLEYLGQIAGALISAGRDSRTPVSVIVDGTLPAQHIITTGLGAVAGAVSEAGLRPPAIVVIGEVVQVGAQIAELSRNVLSKARRTAGPTSPGPAGARPTREGQ
ncbi:MAG TPA: uroporphyrinogen-III C-methyltransferase [Streptosporangiaceae bacterium]|nr:uroporphyrinogen-III C-methyltransferase [Streptosporangiaceae bacterium]